MSDPIKIWPRIALTGGTSGSLDDIPSANIANNEPAVTFVSGYVYLHQYDSTSAAAESSPDVIAPDDIGGGNGRWLLVCAVDQDVTSGSTPTFTATYITGVPAASVLAGTFGTGGYFMDTSLGVPEISNPAGDFKIQPDVQGNVVLFGGTDVGDDEDGKSFFLFRKAAEGDEYIKMQVDKNRSCSFISTRTMYFHATTGSAYFYADTGNLSFQHPAGGDVLFFESSSSGENRYIKQAGYITAVANEVEINWQVSDTDDCFHLARENANILGFKVDMPFYPTAGTATPGTAPIYFTAGTLLSSPVAGALEYADGKLYFTNTCTQRALDRTSGVLTSTVTVADTVTETTLLTELIPANCTRSGNVIKFQGFGVMSTATAADDITLNVYMGSTLIMTFNPAIGNVTNDHWHVEGELIVRDADSSGTMVHHGSMHIAGSADFDVGIDSGIDFTAAQDITIKCVWDNAKAGNTISIYGGYMEFKN